MASAEAEARSVASNTTRTDMKRQPEEHVRHDYDSVTSDQGTQADDETPSPTLGTRGEALATSHGAAAAAGDPEKGIVGLTDADDDDKDQDPNIVGWDGPDDPENPYNWTKWRKIVNCAIISLLTLFTPLASSIFAPAVPELMRDFGSSSSELAGFVMSVYVLGFAFGPILIAPLSEIYGRGPVYHACNVGFVAFLVACALAPNLNAMIVFRFLSGVFGSCPLTNGGGSIADMVVQEKRGVAMSVFGIGPLLGPIIGPVVGGFLADAAGWRWVFWLLVIMSGALSLSMVFFMHETFAPVILQRKVDRLRKETGNQLLRSKMDQGLSPKDHFKRGIVRPMKMLFKSPIVALLAAYIAIVYGYSYILFTSMSAVFEGYYGFNTQSSGLSFLGMGVGSISGLAIFSTTSDRRVKKMAARDGQGMKPEYRLFYQPLGGVMMPLGLFLYGWTVEYRVHWIVPIIGTAIIGAGLIIIFMTLQIYLVDAFPLYAASALAANTIARSIVGALLPLVALRMYDAMGMGWGNSMLGFIALGLVPAPLFIMKKGEWLRTRYEMKDL